MEILGWRQRQHVGISVVAPGPSHEGVGQGGCPTCPGCRVNWGVLGVMGDAGGGCIPGPALSQDWLPAERLHLDAAMLARGWGCWGISIKQGFKDLR